ncbi:RHS repeat-associated core domain-containing protein [Gilliamella apicola]|nr:RHS repeat-associated core domain-containing protein [Gilliamella apicola]
MDEAGEIVWECSYQLWGKPIQEIAHREIQQNLRYQGQYLDRETGLHYNTFRYYDPDTGRFTQPDPIGLLGGINLYQYAPNGLTWIDPWGLACANDGKGKKHGGEGHNKIIDKIIKDVRKEGAEEIRKNHQQVDFNGNKVGTNKPDVQYNYKGKHYNIEVDTTLKGSLGHQSTIPSRDPNARNTFWLIDKSGSILGGLSIF